MNEHPDSESPAELPENSDPSKQHDAAPASRENDVDPEATFVGPFSRETPGQEPDETFVGDIPDVVEDNQNDVDSDKTLVTDGILDNFASSLASEHQDLDRTLPHTSLKPEGSEHEDWMAALESFPSTNSVSRRSVQTGGPDVDDVELTDSPAGNRLDYLTLSLLGEGGMGTVHLARQIALGREVALKTIHGHSSEKQSVRNEFLTEAVLTGRLEHPNIVPIHEVGESPDGGLFYSMKNVKGLAWDETIDDLTLDQNLKILIDVCNAIAFAHAEGVIHRDLKPQNIMTGGFGEVLVLDWGLAVLSESGDDVIASAGGTPSYMAPEMITPPYLVGPRSDVYLLGAILFRFLTGESPHAGDSARKCLEAVSRNEIVTPDPERIQKLDPTGELLSVALKAMSAAPADRYQTVGDFQQAVREFESHQESLKLAASAELALQAAEQSGDYTRYSESVFGFQQAVELWTGNTTAAEGIERARQSYAVCAEKKEDYELSLSLLDESDTEQGEMISRLTAARDERNARQGRLKRMKQGLLAASILMLAVVTGAAFWINQERIKADQQRVAADAQRGIAVEEKNKAEQARQNEAKQRELADQKTTEADESRKTAERARDTLNETLTRSYFLTANEHLESGETDIGLAYLARSLRTDSSYWPAANQIISVLSDHNHLLNEAFTIETEQPINFAGLEKHTRTFYWTLTTGRQGTLWNVKTRAKVGVFAGGVRVDYPTFTKDASLVFVSLRDQGGSIQGFNTTDLKAATPLIPIKNRIDRGYFVAEPRPKVLRLVVDQPGTNHFNIWDAASGKLIGRQLSIAKNSIIDSVRMSADDKYVIATFRDLSLGIWNVEDAKLVFQSKTASRVSLLPGKNTQYLLGVPFGSGNIAQWIDLSADEKKLESLDVGFRIEDASVHADTPLATFIGRTDTTLRAVAIDMAKGTLTADFSLEDFAAANVPLGAQIARNVIATGFRGYVANEAWLGVFRNPDGTAVECRDLYTGKSVSTFDFSANPITTLLLPPDGLRLITEHEDFSVRSWSIINTRPLIEPIHHPLPPDITMSRDGERLFTVTLDDLKLRCWSTRTGKPIQEGHAFSSSFIRSIDSLTDPKSMLHLEQTVFDSGSGKKLLNGRARAWTLESRQRTFPRLSFPGRVSGASFSPDGTLFAAQTLNNLNSVAKILNSDSLAEVRAFQLPGSGTSSQFSPDATSIAISCADGSVRTWDVETGELKTTMVLGEPVSRARYTPDGKTIVAATSSGQIRAFDADTGYGIHDAWDLQSVNFDLNHDGTLVATGNAAGDQFLINLTSGKVTRLLPRALNAISGISFSPDGSVVVSAPFGGRLRAWDTKTLEVVFETPEIDYYTAAVFHPDGDVIAACASPQPKIKWGKIELWNWKKNSQISEPLMAKGQSDMGRIVFSHNGRLLAFGNYLGDISVWEYPTGANLLSRSLGSGSKIASVAFRPNDRQLLVSGAVPPSTTGKVTMIDLPPMDQKTPGWLAELAETVAQRRIDKNGETLVVDRSTMKQLQARIEADDADDPYRQWGLWYLAAPDKRTVSPWSNQPASERLASLLKPKSMSNLNKALELDPTNGFAHAMIGYVKTVFMPASKLKPHVVIHWKEMAQWHTEQAIGFAPTNPDVWALRALVMYHGMRLDEMAKAVETALKLDPDNLLAHYAQSFLLNSKGQADLAFASFRTAYDKLPAARPPYDWQNGRPFLPGILDAVMQQRDRSPVSLASAGKVRAAQKSGTPQDRRLELDWLTRLAVEIHPQDPVVWETRSNALLLAGRPTEAIQALKRASDLDQDGKIPPLRVGELIRNAANRLASQTQFAAAHKLLLGPGIPKRSPKATPQQVDLSNHYNQTLFDSVYRSRTSASGLGGLWQELPIGLVNLNGIDFDLRGVIRLVGADTANKDLLSAPPTRVENIVVNQKAAWIHVLHNCSAIPNIPHGRPLGRYLLHFQDGTSASLPIEYGKHVVTWAGNPFATPTHAIFGWKESDYSATKTLSHCTWENPKPTQLIKSITFESAGVRGSPFLVAISLESPATPRKEQDTKSILREARLKATMVNGATATTFDHVTALLKQVGPTTKLTPTLKLQHAIVSAENMTARGLHDDALKHLEGVSSRDTGSENTLLKLRARIHQANGEMQTASQVFGLSVAKEDYRVGKPVGLDHQLTQRLFKRHIATKGKRIAREFVLRSQIPPRQPGTSRSMIDLTKSYNAGLHEAWQRGVAASVIMPPLYRTMRTGVRHFRGIPFDIRGVVNLTGGNRFDIAFPPRVSNIVVDAKADQLHFLNGGFSETVTGAPVAVYRVVYSDGKAVNFPARYRVELGDCWLAQNDTNVQNLAWRGEGAAAFTSKKDTALYLATWTNPRPDVTISHIDFIATLKQVNPYLVAITAERFEESLTDDVIPARELARRAVHKASRPNASKALLQYAVKLSQRATTLAPEDAEVWRLQSEMYLAMGQPQDASASSERTLKLAPESGEALYTQEKILVKLGQTDEALRIRTQARKMTLKGRITPRDKSLPAHFIDLTSHYNAALSENPYLERRRVPFFDDKLDGLTDGLGIYNGVSFDVRGVIALHGSRTQLREYVAVLTNGVRGIPVEQTAKTVHFLHGTSWAGRIPHGTTIGKYNFHYKDGSTEFTDIRYGEHVLDWWLRDKRTATKAKLAHTQRSIRDADRQLGCYQMKWTNPKPDIPISHIDFETYGTEAAPFLLGITLTPVADPESKK